MLVKCSLGMGPLNIMSWFFEDIPVLLYHFDVSALFIIVDSPAVIIFSIFDFDTEVRQ